MKTADELQITERERAYLILARDVLATMGHRKPTQIQGDGTFLFDMGTVLRPLDPGEALVTPADEEAYDSYLVKMGSPGDTPGTYACGSAGCIAGLMNLLAGLDPEGLLWPAYTAGRVSMDELHPFYRLFFPGNLNYPLVTPADAVRAINNFLETGEGHASWAGWNNWTESR